MKTLLITVVVVLIMMLNQQCAKHNVSDTCRKGRLEVNGICGNYTIRLLEGRIDTANIVANWKDDVSGKTYSNVFALGNPCSFPSTINAGDEFYFTLDDAKQQCAVCLAYYPTPPKKISIKVLDKPCR